MVSEKQKEANKKYREKNRQRVNDINRKSNKKRYEENEDIRINKSVYYFNNRNARDAENLGKAINILFEEIA
tara:strand:+ start:1798 stop:2013 length:216 start_codon:yes stop_codon:yes gene_type:complete